MEEKSELCGAGIPSHLMGCHGNVMDCAKIGRGIQLEKIERVIKKEKVIRCLLFVITQKSLAVSEAIPEIAVICKSQKM